MSEGQDLFRSLVDNALDAVVTLDAAGRIIGWNPMAERRFGWSAKEAIGLRLAETILPERSREAVERSLQDDRERQPSPARRMEVAARRKSGEEFPVELTITALREASGVSYSVFVRDISERQRAEAALLAQKDLFARLVAVARAAPERPTLEATLRKAFAVLESVTGAEGGSLLLLDVEGRASMTLLGERARERVGPEQTDLVMRKGLAGWVARERRSALVPDATADERVITLPVQRFVLGSAVSVPIVRAARLVGVITLVHPARGHFSAEHLEFLEAAADQLGLAVLNAQYVEALRQAGERQSLLHRVLRSAAEQLDPEAALDAAVGTMAKRPGWVNVAISVPPFGEGVAGRAFETGATQITSESNAPGAGIRSELAVPLQRGKDRLGILSIQSEAPDAFRPEDVRLAESLADNVALALDNARLHQAILGEDHRLQAVIRSSRDGIMLVGTDGRVLVLNDMALRLLERPESSDAWVSRPLGELMAALGRKQRRALEAATAVVAAGSAPRIGGYEGARIVRCLSHGVVARGAAVGRLVVLRDITEDKTLERMREDLTRTMVHDLRGPLTVILSSLALMRTESESQPTLQDHVQRAAEEMKVLIDGILDISRLEQGSFPLERRSVSLAVLLPELVSQATPVANRKGLQLRCEVPDQVPPAWADPALLGRIVQNLVQNAMKFTPESGTISIGVGEQPANGWLHVAVEDSGPGIPDDLAGRLFQKFAAGRGEGCGSGLGLAFCRLAVEAHGGRIVVEPGRLGGARFQFTLPTYPPSASVLAEP